MKTYKQFVLEVSNSELQRLMSKPPGSHTEAEKKILLDNGLDDFVRGGKTASPVSDLAMLGATFAAVKGAPMIGKAINTGLGVYSAYQTVNKLSKGDYKGAGLEALGMIPGGKYAAKGVSKIPAVANLINKGNKAQRFVGGAIKTTSGLGASTAQLQLPTEKNKLINKAFDKATNSIGIPSEPQQPTQRSNDEIKREREKVVAARKQASTNKEYGATKGSALVGTGGRMDVNMKTNTITTGGKTVQLPKTKLLSNGKVGDLAYRNGKPVYLARGDMAIRGNQNLFARLSRATGIGGQRERDAAAVAKEKQQAQQNLNKYKSDLGIKPSTNTPRPASTPATKPVNAKSAQAYAASKGKYYSNTTGKTYANYAAALKDIKNK